MSVSLLRRWLPVAVFILIPSVLIFPILLSGKMLYGADVVSVFHYSRIVIADAFRSGRLPVWDPHVMAGFPLLAGVQGAIFYPPTWLCVLMSAGTFWTLSVWAHLVLAGVFAHRWLERGLGLNRWSATAGAVIYLLSGYISGHVYAGHVNYVWAYPWIPAVLWRLEEYLAAPTLKSGVWLAVVFSMLFLAGVPQFVFFAALIVFARFVHFVLFSVEGRRGRAVLALRSSGWLLLGLAFCAPQLFPTLELIGEMQRGKGSASDFYTAQSLRPDQIGQLVLPPDQQESKWWESCGFVGGAALLLALAISLGKHPQRYLWIAVAVLGLAVALGEEVPFHRGIAAVVPGVGWFRGPGRFLLLFTVAMAGLAAIGFEALWNRGPRGIRILGAVLSAASLAQLIAFAHPCFLGSYAEALSLSGGVRTELKRSCGLEGRVANGNPDVSLIGRCQAAGLDQVCGYEPMMLRRYAETMNAAGGHAPGRDVVILASVGPHPVIQMLATRIWLLGYAGTLRTFENPLPRSWVVNNAVVIEDKVLRLKALAKGPWDPAKTVILESYPADAPPVPTEKPAGRTKVLARSPGYYEIEAENDADAYLVLSEAYYPGWRAEVDGRPADVLPANHLIQTIRLPAGKHVVRFQYRSRFLALGFAVAALAALVPVGLLVLRHRRQLALQRLPGAP